jgi:hypothetical protein
VENYISIDQAIQKIKDQTKQPFDYSNIADLVLQDIFTPVFPYIGYLCSVSDGMVYDLNKRSCYLQPVKNNHLVELIQGKRSKHSASMVDDYICGSDGDYLLAEMITDQEIRYALYEYDVLACSPLSLPTDFHGFMSYHPTEPYEFTRSSLRINNNEIDKYLSSISEKNEQTSTFLNSQDDKTAGKNLRVIGAMMYALTDSNVQRPHKMNQSWLAQTIEDLTKNSSAGMGKSTLEKLFRDANKAFEPYKPQKQK